jgi:osmoprotectant transport system permease protein
LTFQLFLFLMPLSRVNRIALLGSLVALLGGVLLPILTLKPNRLLAGRGVDAFALELEGWVFVGVALVGVALSLWRSPARGWGLAVLGNIALPLQLWALGSSATRLVAGIDLARVSPNAGAWLGLLGAGLMVYGALNELRAANRVARVALSSLGVVGAAGVVALGGVGDLSVLREFTANRAVFWDQLGQHAILTVAALVLSSLVGLPLGVWAARNKRVAAAVIAVSSGLQTVPSVALLTLLIAPYSALARAVPALDAIGVRGIGAAPALTALTLYGLLPIVRGTLNGLRGVDEAALEAARGMGMTNAQLFWRVQVPLALPLVLEGVRLSAVSLVGLAALSSLVGAGGLGFFIFSGLGSGALDLVLLGAIPTLALAVLVNFALSSLERAMIPRGLR